jgi:hypothetical protein
MATAGRVLGWLNIVFCVLGFIFFFVMGGFIAQAP